MIAMRKTLGFALALCCATGFAAGGCSSSVGNQGGTGGTIATGGTTGAGGGSAGGATQVGSIGGCRLFPADNPWNQDVSSLSLSAMGATYLNNMNTSKGLHPDWGDYAANQDYYGIPFASGTGATPVTVKFNQSPDQSDPDPCASGGGMFCYPIPLTAPIEGGPRAAAGADRHVLYIDTAGAPNSCTLYELYAAANPTTSWTAGSGAIFHLGSNALRPDGWTSADAAGLPILPGLVRFDETVNQKVITHAIRFTMNSTQEAYIHPATHAAGSSNAGLPPMGLRLRMKASFDTSRFSGPSLVIMTAMKKYGIILADNGSDWFISGESNDAWVPYMDQLVTDFGKIHGSDFEVVDTGAVSTAGL